MKRLVFTLIFAGVVGVATRHATPTSAATAYSPSAAAAPITVHYRSATIDGVKVFYREAGPANGPVILLLHGFPTSSHMFRNLIPTLADRYRVIAPDYPGFGQSDAPDHTKFAYTFGHYADIVDSLMGQLGAKNYVMYVMDYGAPVGYRLALKHPERVTGLIIQNGNAYVEGLTDFWNPIKAYWADGSAKNREALAGLVTLDTTKFQYTDGVKDLSRISPDNWVIDQGSRPSSASASHRRLSSGARTTRFSRRWAHIPICGTCRPPKCIFWIPVISRSRTSSTRWHL